MSEHETIDEIEFYRECAKSPAITKEEMYAIEKEYQEDPGVERRILLGILTKSGQSLGEFAVEHPETVFEMFESGVSYIEHQRYFLEMLETAGYRIMIALSALDESDKDAPFSGEQFSSLAERLMVATPETCEEVKA